MPGGFPFGPGPAPTEPSSDARQGALGMWGQFVAYTEAGFTPDQALFLLGQALSGWTMGSAIAQGGAAGGSS